MHDGNRKAKTCMPEREWLSWLSDASATVVAGNECRVVGIVSGRVLSGLPQQQEKDKCGVAGIGRMCVFETRAVRGAG